VSLLLRALYSLKQSLHLWQEKLYKELEKLGYKPIEADHCIYTTNAGLQGIIIITYVNDFLLIGPNIQEIKALKAQLSKVFLIKDLSPYSMFLRVQLIQDRKNQTIHLT
jgi:hypothetical protein